MNTARIAVLAVAIGAGGIAAYLASGSDKSATPVEPVVQLQTVDVLVAKSDIGLDQTEAIKPTNAAKASTSSGTAGVVSPQMMQK